LGPFSFFLSLYFWLYFPEEGTTIPVQLYVQVDSSSSTSALSLSIT
jgi:hypothetical protein